MTFTKCTWHRIELEKDHCSFFWKVGWGEGRGLVTTQKTIFPSEILWFVFRSMREENLEMKRQNLYNLFTIHVYNRFV